MTPKRVQFIDMYIVYIVLTGVVQFVYMGLVGQYPFNSFLSGFIGAVGSFVLAVALRMQTTQPKEFHGISQQRSFTDFVACNLLLHFVVATFMG